MSQICEDARRRDEAIPLPSRQGSDHEAPLCRVDNEGSCSPLIGVPPPVVDDLSGAALSAEGRKRVFTSQSFTPGTGLPSKRSKTTHDVASGQPELSHDGPSEIVVLYEPPSKLTFTTLYKQLRGVDEEEQYSRRHFSAALHVLLDMGPCASDLVWRRALSDLDASVSQAYNEDDEHAKEYVALFEIRELIKNWEYTMPNLDPSSRGLNVTPKFLKLVQILQSCRPHEDSFRGIVFVRRRAVALVMSELLRLLDITGLRPQVLVGKDIHTDFLSQNEIFHDFETGTYNLIIATKWAEDLEIPPASVVVRYDLFDSQLSYANCRSRTRGRGSHLLHMIQRGYDSHRHRLLQLTRFDEATQIWMNSTVQNSESAIHPVVIVDSHDPYLSDSEDEDDSAEFIKDPTTGGHIRIQDATGIINRFAADISSGETPSGPVTPLFRFESVLTSQTSQPLFICTVTLPPGPHVSPASGLPSVSKAHARRTACFQMCKELFERGLLDPQLFPRPPLQISRPRRVPDVCHTLDHTGEDSFKTSLSQPNGNRKQSGLHSYPRKKPEFWTNVVALKSAILYPTVISVRDQEQYGPLILLTRAPLPRMSSLKLFDSGFPIAINLKQGASFAVDPERLHDLYLYTIRIYRSIVNKPLVCMLEGMPHFLAPLRASWVGFNRKQASRWVIDEIADDIPWDQVKLAAHKWVTELSAENLESSLEDAIIQDRWIEYTRRYYFIRVRRDLTPLSKPVDSPREAKYRSFLEYCKERRKGFEGLRDCNQPLIEVDRVLPVLNRLNPASKNPPNPTKHPAKYLIPELCALFTIPASTFRTALLLPSVMRRIDDMLLVTELNATLFDHSIHEPQLHAAISAPSACAEFDYERLELLGDAYLKYLSSIYLFVTNPSQHEGALHSARLRIISNRALFFNAENAGLAPYIQAKPLVPKQWYPPNFTVIPPPPPKVQENESVTRVDQDSTERETGVDASDIQDIKQEETNRVSPGLWLKIGLGPSESDAHQVAVDSVEPRESAAYEGFSAEPGQDDMDGVPIKGAAKPNTEKLSSKKSKKDDQNVQWLSDKAIADVAEAIIGAAYITGGSETALNASKALRIAVPSIDQWSDFARKALAPPPDVTTRLRPGTVEAIEEIMGHKFNRPHLLAQALTHASIQGFEMTCYQRLEFLGDAILDFLVIRHIYGRDATLSPGALTLLKGAMVSNQALGAICVEVGLHEHLMFESFDLASKIRAYTENLKRKRNAEYESAEEEGRAPGQYWIDTIPPKALSDVVESVIGAIFISDNFSPEGAQSFFDKILKPFYDKHITLRTLSHHPTKTLFEVFQAHGCQQFEVTREYESTEDFSSGTVCNVVIHDVILASAGGPSAVYAAKRAAVYALDAIEGDPDFITRTCDCRAKTQAKKANKKALKQMLASLQDQSEDQPSMKKTSIVADGDEDNMVTEKGDTKNSSECSPT
ncbi:ribonuclease III [Lactarius vividus]|nr:ribonuclease III [Lactarius vividus]